MAEFKTNVMRMLDKEKVPYTPHTYDHGDGAIDENDALVLLQVANGTHDALSEADTAKYDFDGDGALTTADAQLYLAGLHNEPESPNVCAAAVTVPASGSVSVKATVKLSEADRASMTICLKADQTTKMGIVTDVKQELRRANALKVSYAASKSLGY